MKKYIKTNNHTEFLINKKIDLIKVQDKILGLLQLQKWEDNPDKIGFSGLSMIEGKDENGNINNKIILHWTNDGVNGFNIKLSNTDKIKVKNILDDDSVNYLEVNKDDLLTELKKLNDRLNILEKKNENTKTN
jgi:hypothetical protein